MSACRRPGSCRRPRGEQEHRAAFSATPSAGRTSRFRRGRGITVTGTPERGVVVLKARELVELGRKYGYRLDELVEIIENVG